MKLRVTTIVVNGLMAVLKLLITYSQLGIPKLRAGALVHGVEAVVLIAAVVLTWKRNWAGPLLAMVVLGYSILKSLSLGYLLSEFKTLEMQLVFILPIVIHVLVFVLNFVAFRAMKREGK